MPIIRRLCYADVNARIKTQVFIGLIREPGVECANPTGILFGAHAAEKFHMVGKLADDAWPMLTELAISA